MISIIFKKTILKVKTIIVNIVVLSEVNSFLHSVCIEFLCEMPRNVVHSRHEWNSSELNKKYVNNKSVKISNKSVKISNKSAISELQQKQLHENLLTKGS